MKKTPRLISLLAGAFLISNLVLGAFPTPTNHYSISNYEGYKTCKGCHDGDFDTHINNLLNSIHWTWEKTDSATGDAVGKNKVINNYCVAVASNEPRCTSCHIGIGWNQSTDIRAAANPEEHIDCFVCHDGTGTYQKNPMGAGAPVDGLDYTAIVRSLQNPGRDNCGACHFFGGGGEGVKHGTMDSSLSLPSEQVDVHMGRGMDCVDCHGYNAANEVAFVGSRYSKDTHDAQMCIDCHASGGQINGVPIPSTSSHMSNHLSVLACQTCHVPAMAVGGKATKTYWDWETAGNYILDNGSKVDRVIKNGDGDIVYHSKKGTFVWGYDIVPQYEWANGNVDHITISDTIDPNGRNHINTFESTVEKPGLVFPVKKFVGRQPYDTANKNLVVPHLFPTPEEKAGTATKKAYWMVYDWEKAAEAGMAAYGGGASFDPATSDIAFAETDFTWVANHMVAPKSEVVECWECHKSKDRINMADLGLNGTQEDLYNVTYAGYKVMYESTNAFSGPDPSSSQIIDTGAYMGYLEVSNAPWIYSFNMGKYLYMPEEGGGFFGSWAYMPK